MNFIKKWYMYQKERFPFITYGIYVFSLVFATFCICNYYNGQANNINFLLLIPMFLTAFLQFLMVRIIDEFKDYEEDLKYRPYRPVPRGLISLKELKILFVICIIVQTIITFVFNKIGMIYLVFVWLYFFFMSKSFFIKRFLDKHLLIEVFLDEILMPLLILYLASYINIQNIWILLIMSYIIAWIVEIARKIRCKEDEENGVKTYTKVLGINNATLLLFILETILTTVEIIVLGEKNIIIVLCVYMFIELINLLFIIKKTRILSKFVELCANIYIIFIYLSFIALL